MAAICAPCGAIQNEIVESWTPYRSHMPETCWCCAASPVVLADDEEDAQ